MDDASWICVHVLLNVFLSRNLSQFVLLPCVIVECFGRHFVFFGFQFESFLQPSSIQTWSFFLFLWSRKYIRLSLAICICSWNCLITNFDYQARKFYRGFLWIPREIRWFRSSIPINSSRSLSQFAFHRLFDDLFSFACRRSVLVARSNYMMLWSLPISFGISFHLSLWPWTFLAALWYWCWIRCLWYVMFLIC